MLLLLVVGDIPPMLLEMLSEVLINHSNESLR